MAVRSEHFSTTALSPCQELITIIADRDNLELSIVSARQVPWAPFFRIDPINDSSHPPFSAPLRGLSNLAAFAVLFSKRKSRPAAKKPRHSPYCQLTIILRNLAEGNPAHHESKELRRYRRKSRHRIRACQAFGLRWRHHDRRFADCRRFIGTSGCCPCAGRCHQRRDQCKPIT